MTLPETDFTSHALLAVNGLSHEFRELNQAIACHGAALITDGATVMTISHSSVVTATMAKAKQMGKRFRVIQLASAPGNEGYVAASKLDQLHIPTQIITDAQAGLFIPRTDMLMVGCDSWLSDHYFVNKAGTYSLALLAKAHGKPFWVLADHYKNSKQDHTQVTLEEMDSEELDAPEGDFIKARNIYFETVPCELVAGRVDESGSHEL